MMGYSLSVVLKNKNERDEMLSFLYRDDISSIISKALQNIKHETISPVEGAGLGYSPPLKSLDSVLGFNGRDISSPMWLVAGWVACKAGVRYRGNPYLYYDRQRIPIFFNQSHHIDQNPGSLQADSHGVLLLPKRKIMDVLAGRPSSRGLPEMVNSLNETWNREHATGVVLNSKNKMKM